jgi:hypothetical protein
MRENDEHSQRRLDMPNCLPFNASMSIDGNAVGNMAISQVGTHVQMTFTPTGGSAQGPWTLDYHAKGCSFGNSTINLTINGATFDKITGSLNGKRGSGTLHAAGIRASDVSWSAEETFDKKTKHATKY